MALWHLMLTDEYDAVLKRFNESNVWVSPDYPWFGTYTDCGEVVVCAPDEDSARLIASETSERFLDPRLTKCDELDPNGEPEFIIGNFPTG